MNKILITSLITTILVSTIFVGCGQKTTVQQTQKVEVEQFPSWIDSPSYEDSIAITVSSTKNATTSFNTTRDEAYKNAKNELDINLKIKISTTIKSLSTKNASIEDIDSAAKQITKNIIDRAKIVKLFQSKTGTIYVLNTIKISLITNEMDKFLSTSSNTKLYQNFLMAKSDGSLDIKLQNN